MVAQNLSDVAIAGFPIGKISVVAE